MITLFLISLILIPERVEVFYNGAKIEYLVKVPVKKGYNEIILTGLPEGSSVLTVKAEKGVKIIGFNLEDSLNTIEASIVSSYDSIRRRYEILSWERKIVNREKEFLFELLSPQFIKYDSLSVRNFSMFLNIVKKKSRSLMEEELVIDNKLKDIKLKMDLLSDSLNMLKKGVLKVSLLSKVARNININVEVFNSRIFYTPEYSLDAIASKDMVLLSLSANLKNTTSFTLDKVNVSLVMQDFSWGGIINIEPERYYYPFNFKRNMGVKGKTKNLEKLETLEPIVEKNYTTGVKFSLEGRYTIPKKGDLTVRMCDDTLTASFIRRAYPRKYNGVFLYANVRANNWPIRLKNVRVFVDGVYQGKWSHPKREVVFQDDTFFVSFGKDMGLEVERLTIKNKVSETWMGKKLSEFHYRTTLKSHKKKPTKVILYDNLPVFYTDDYSLKDVKITPESFTLEKESGIIKWVVIIPPSGVERFDVSYKVVKEK